MVARGTSTVRKTRITETVVLNVNPITPPDGDRVDSVTRAESGYQDAAAVAVEACFKYLKITATSAKDSVCPDMLIAEAATRYLGWMIDSSPTFSSGQSVDAEADGGASRSFVYKGGKGGFRASGAMAMLSPYRVRRAGAIAGKAAEE